MSHAEPFRHIQITQLHPTFGAEISGIDFSKPVAAGVFSEVLAAITKYGVLVFRNAHLDDHRHVAFAHQFGELDDIKPHIAAGRKNRFPSDKLFDVSNLNDDGSVLQPGTPRYETGLGNGLFHVDSSFNPRRAGYSLLRAHQLNPKGTGGGTEFADTRTAWDILPDAKKRELMEKDYIIGHSLWYSRKKAAPESEYLKTINPKEHFISRHRLLQTHASSGRKNLYIAAHAMQVEDPDYASPSPGPPGKLLPEDEASKIIDEIWNFCQQPELTLKVDWENDGDLLIWDNTCVMHRSGPGTYHGKFVRDMRRATVHDGTTTIPSLHTTSSSSPTHHDDSSPLQSDAPRRARLSCPQLGKGGFHSAPYWRLPTANPGAISIAKAEPKLLS
ncbi:alpha-ketoglutarate-dependent 2-4-dichlorophenoxyacetate dioxygenase [Venturia nashicola]|nr:alpha-ketoglutarate-dependent 2-4-dichlorophenoxyacetate dioxygenase [Venturia nashicola]